MQINTHIFTHTLSTKYHTHLHTHTSTHKQDIFIQIYISSNGTKIVVPLLDFPLESM